MGDDQELQDRRVAALLDDGVAYRQVAALLGLPATSEAGCAARDLFDHGRGGEAFDVWMGAAQMREP